MQIVVYPLDSSNFQLRFFYNCSDEKSEYEFLPFCDSLVVSSRVLGWMIRQVTLHAFVRDFRYPFCIPFV